MKYFTYKADVLTSITRQLLVPGPNDDTHIEPVEILKSQLATEFTGWSKPIGCPIFTGNFSQKSPIIRGSFAKKNLQLEASY